MKIESVVCFDDRHYEGDIFRTAFNPIARLNEYPDLLAELANEGIKDFEHVTRIVHSLTFNNHTDWFRYEYLVRAHRILRALKLALTRDLSLNYKAEGNGISNAAAEQMADKAIAMLLDIRREQIRACDPALEILNAALMALARAA